MVLTTPGGEYTGGRAGENLELHRSRSEHYFPIYRDSSDIGAVSGGVPAPRVTGPKAVVGIGGDGMGGQVVGGEGGRCGGDGYSGVRGGWGGGRERRISQRLTLASNTTRGGA